MSRVGVVGRQLLHQLHGRNVSTPTDVKMSDDGVTVVEVLVQMHEGSRSSACDFPEAGGESVLTCVVVPRLPT